MTIYLVGMLILCYPSIVVIPKLSCYACVSIDDHVLIWFLHPMITRNTILFEFILLLYMRVCYLIVYSVLYLLEWDIPMSMCAMHILYAHCFFPWFICWTLCAIICWFVTLIHFGQHKWLVILLEVLTVMWSFAQFVSPWILVGMFMHSYYV